ncbi:acyl-CoA dehydrogenase family protein, partial [bacterium]|nr:acyl-CoA dehydrogenase family protein [bacterium]
MDFERSPEEEAFRAEVRAWLRANLPPGWGTDPSVRPGTVEERIAFARRWQRKLHEGGWAGISWPREYGGRDLDALQQLAFSEEYVAAGAPDMIDIGVGVGLTGPTLVHHGTPWQKERFLEPILRGDEVWCQGFSEPGSGSDLASLRTRGEVDGDDVVVNGQKVWTSYARFADWCILIVRTNASVPKHKGLTFLLLDMKTPGITIRPLVEMTGVAWFNEVFFENVRVPRRCVVGEIDRGWDITMTTLSHERVGTVPYQRLRQQLEGAIALAKRAGDPGAGTSDAATRQELARLAIEIEALRLSAYRSVSEIMRAGRPGPEGSMLKLVWSEIEQRVMEAAARIEGPWSLLAEED